jgi:hypothetical protein
MHVHTIMHAWVRYFRPGCLLEHKRHLPHVTKAMHARINMFRPSPMPNCVCLRAAPLFDERKEIIVGAKAVGTYDITDDGEPGKLPLL